MRRLPLLSAALLTVLAILAASGRPQARAAGPRTSARLAARLAAHPGAAQKIWVYFRDKGPDPMARLAEAGITARARARRALRGTGAPGTLADVPLARAYVDAVAARVSRVRQQVRWSNALSVEATPDQVEAVLALPFVDHLDLVRAYARRPDDERGGGRVEASSPARARAAAAFDYGPSAGQLEQIGVPALHDLGLHGEGVMIAMLDAGFDTLSHEVFAAMSIVDQHDFVNGDDDVANGRDRGEGSHGTMTLSTIGGWAPTHLIGPAFNATYILAKTEDTTSETPVEEDNWAAAAEWAEAHGADVISSSLGYLTFDPGFTSYTAADMDGNTAISTRAADLAGQRGVVVVNSAGNEGFNATHNTLGAPADGFLVLAVGAVTSTGQRISFSSVGPSADGRVKPDVAAQGVDVVVAAPGTASGYTRASGTSFSCPLTAGVAALLVQARPDARVTEIDDALRATASQAAQPDTLLGFGIVNGARALQALAR
jgi:subtilisin family serine protease